MKKLLLGLMVTVLGVGGSVGLGQTSASAACPYTGCTRTQVAVVDGPTAVKAGARPAYDVEVTTNGSSVPKGRIKIIVKSPAARHVGNKDYYYSRGEDTRRGTAKFTLPEMRKGTYNVTVRYIKKPGSVWKNSTTKFVLKVTKRKS